MKRFIFIVITALLLFSACGSKLDKVSSESETEASAVTIEDTASATEQASVLNESEAHGSSPESGETEPEESSEPAPPLTFTLVIPEGYTLARIGMTLEDKGLCTADEFIAAAQNGDFSEFPLVAAQTTSAERCFKLEGYLFPDTYDIYTSETPDAVIRRILEHTEQKITADLREEIRASGYTIDEILTMASIIEKEAFGEEHMPKISSVLHNRLNVGMRLQCDVSITYVEGAIKPFITGDIDRYNSYYNTYKCPGLPAGAICNPGLPAIQAALHPEDTNYYYFVTDPDKNYYYAETWEDHLQNLDVIKGE